MNSRHYLDYNASAPLRPVAREAVLRALDGPGNASSIHAEGRAARALIEDARRHVAELVGADPRGIVFTAGATEAANLSLTPDLAIPGRARPMRCLALATEHACVLFGHRFDGLELIPVDGRGLADLAALEHMLQVAEKPCLVALQAANGETGVVQPVAEAARLVRAHGGVLVCDAVQAAGRIDIGPRTLGADALVLSSHKIGGPKGAGALVFADPDATIDLPLLRGGGQERRLRAGTEDVAAIAGFGAAAREVAAKGSEEARHVAALRDGWERALSDVTPQAIVFGAGAPRLPNTSCFAVPGLKANTLLMALDLAGVAVSAGSACSSGKIARSHVLDAMGAAPHMGDGAIRASFGWGSDAADMAALRDALAMVIARRRPSGRAA